MDETINSPTVIPPPFTAAQPMASPPWEKHPAPLTLRESQKRRDGPMRVELVNNLTARTFAPIIFSHHGQWAGLLPLWQWTHHTNVSCWHLTEAHAPFFSPPPHHHHPIHGCPVSSFFFGGEWLQQLLMCSSSCWSLDKPEGECTSAFLSSMFTGAHFSSSTDARQDSVSSARFRRCCCSMCLMSRSHSKHGGCVWKQRARPAQRSAGDVMTLGRRLLARGGRAVPPP